MSLAYFNRALDRGGELTNVLRLQALTAAVDVTITLMGDFQDLDCVKTESLAVGDFLFLDLRKIEKWTSASATGTLSIEKFAMPEFRQPYIVLDSGEATNVITFAPNVGVQGIHEK